MNPAAGLVAAVFEKQLILLRRYWINTAMMLVSTYVFFAMIFYGGQAVAGPAIGEGTLDGIVVGFFLFTATVSAYFGIAGNVMREAQWGTLEQLAMSPFGIGRVMAVKAVWNVSISVGIGLVLLVVMVATTGRTLHLDPVTVVTLAVLSILSVVGIGFVFAGLSLLYKRIENASQLMQFVFIGLIVAPAADGRPLLAALPLTQGSAMLTEAMAADTRLWEFPAADLAVLAAVGVGYLLAGYVVFHLLVRRARTLGVLGHY
ncbi:ABC transporter permease [Natrononativus amylolyticus]|uniref:ABC transporter permease n=1 Tax=Natrononativus amylolyticus TaxID=2963434 RepID=UPI0020CD22B9|nr:ABC transporter permease [Natrononativus amylolyticus]